MIVPKLRVVLTGPLVKYAITGLTAFALEFGSFYLLFTPNHSSLYVANSISFCIGLITSFTLNRIWTFKTGTYKKSASYQLISYILLALINLVLSNLVIGILVRLHIAAGVSKFLAIALIALWNYTIFQRLVFSKHAASSKD